MLLSGLIFFKHIQTSENTLQLSVLIDFQNAKSFESDSEEKMAEVFGRWQTEQYMPPPAYNVSRNNTNRFQPTM